VREAFASELDFVHELDRVIAYLSAQFGNETVKITVPQDFRTAV
jgi:hypothetical protein